MKTRRLLMTTLAMLVVFASASYGAEAKKAKSNVESQNLEAMNKRMTEMQKEMTLIRETKDPKKKQALLEEHMKNMQANIDLMGKTMKDMGMMGGGVSHGNMMGKNQQYMMGQMGQMHGLMGQMMGQMQEHMNSCPFAGDPKKE